MVETGRAAIWPSDLPGRVSWSGLLHMHPDKAVRGAGQAAFQVLDAVVAR